MFLKLIKHDILNSWKDFGLSYLLGLGLAVLLFISKIPGETNIIFSLFVSLLMLGLGLAVTIVSIRALIRLFYSSLYTQDPVLTWTQPVSSTWVLLSKVIVGFIWSLVSIVFIVALMAIFLLLVSQDTVEGLQMIYDMFSEYISVDPSVQIVYIVSFVASYCLQAATILLVGAIANSSWIRQHRNILAVAFFLIIYFTITNIISLVSRGGPIVISTFGSSIYVGLSNGLGSALLFYCGYIVLSAVLFLLGKLVIDHKLEIN